MLGLLFDTQFWYDLLLVIVLIGLIILCVKVKEARLFIFSLCAITIVGVAGYCGIQLNNYYNAAGGIYGYISGLVFPDQTLDTQNSFKLGINNLVLQQETENRFSTQIYTDNQIKFDSKLNYGFFVNENYCSTANISEEYVLASYSYTFFDNEMQELLTDTLHFQFAFYEKGSELKIYTDGGQLAVDYWNKYFSRNTLNISIEECSIIEKDNFEQGTGDISEYKVVNFWYEDEIFLKQVYTVGSIITPPTTCPQLEVGYSIKTWNTSSGEEFDFSKNVVTENLNLYAGELDVAVNEIKFIFSSDGTIENQIDAGRFRIVSQDIISSSGNNTSELLVESTKDNGLIIRVSFRHMFDYFSFADSVFVYGDNGYIESEIELLGGGVLSPTETGFCYYYEFEISSLKTDAIVVIKSQPKTYNLQIGYYVGNDYQTILLDNVYTYGCELDLTKLLSSSQLSALKQNRNSNLKFGGISNRALYGQGTLYYDRNLNSLRPIYLNTLTYNSSEYVYTDWYDPYLNAICLYAVYSTNI